MDGSAAAYTATLQCSLSVSLDSCVMTACMRASSQKAMKRVLPPRPLGKVYPIVCPIVSSKKRGHKLAPRNPPSVTTGGYWGAEGGGGEGLCRGNCFRRA